MPYTPAVRAGSTFGPYRVLEPLGRGGMATVYRAYEASLDRYVALKVLPSESLADPAFTGRFRREAKVIAALEHRHIVPIYAYGIDEGVPWMAMRLVSGGALSARLRAGPFELGRTVGVLAEVAAALDFAHDHGVLHRDVKPQNVLLDDEGHAYLADFGVARMLEGTAAVTRSGVVTGTPLYMSPEQARGEKVDRRTDIYALGIVAYEMLTGHVPFSADTPMAVLMKHIMDPLPLPPASLVPEPAMRAILKCVAKDAAHRWSSARAFVDALGAGAVRASAPESAWASARPTLTQIALSPKRSRFVFAFAVVLFVGCIGGLIYLGLRARGVPPASPEARASPTATPASPSSGETTSRAVTPSPPEASVPPGALSPPGNQPHFQRPTSAAASSAAASQRPIPSAPTTITLPSEGPTAGLAQPSTNTSAPTDAQPHVAVPSPAPTPAAVPGSVVDGVDFLVGRWSGRVHQKKNPFIHRELERPVRTECKRLTDPWRVFCRNDWGIIEDWVVMRHDLAANRYWYEDSDGLKASAPAGAAEIVYEGSRVFGGRAVSWRLTCLAQGTDAFALRMEWSRNSSDWYTMYDASFQRTP